MKFSLMELSKALIVIAAWIIRTKNDKEARQAATAELVALLEKETASAIEKAKDAAGAVARDLAEHPERLRDPDEFQRPPERDAARDSTTESGNRPQ